MAHPPVLYLYMLTTRKPGAHIITQLGCCSDVTARVAAYNSPSPAPGTDRRSRQSAGHWKPLLIVVVPRSRGLSGRALVEQWKVGSRKIHSRFAYGVRMARELGLTYMIDGEELHRDTRIVSKEAKLVAEVLATMHTDEVPAAAIAGLLTDNNKPASDDMFDGFSFARTANPRQRYKRKREETANNARQAKSRSIAPVGDQASPPLMKPKPITPTLLATFLAQAVQTGGNSTLE